MGVIIGVVVGYVLGTQAGEEGWSEFNDAVGVIRTSPEVRDLVVGGLAMARDLLGRGSALLAGTDRSGSLRSVA